VAVRGRPTLTGPESIFNNKHRREASTTELLAMGSTCSTLDGVDAPRSRASQIEQEQREKDAAALEYEIARWMEADAECRGLQTDVTFDPRESSRRQSQPRGFDLEGSGKVRFATDHVTVVPMPTLEEMGPHLTKEVFYSQSDFDRMMTERKKLSVKAANFARQHDLLDEDWDPSNPSLQSACEASPARCGDEYSFVAASANDLDSSVYRISKQNAEAAHKIAEAEHKPVWKSKLYGAFVLNRRVVSTPSTRRCSMAWRCRLLSLYSA